MVDQRTLMGIIKPASAATWPFTAVSTSLFGMRAVSRMYINRSALGWDDLVVSISWILNISRAAFFQKGLDSTKHVRPDALPTTIPAAAFWIVFVDAWAFLSIALPKLGLGILIVRIFKPQSWLKITIMGLCITLNLLAIVGFIMTFVQCNPAAGQWDLFKHPQTRCWPRDVALIYACSVSGLSAFTDIAFSIYPGVVVWGLQMPSWKKLSTMALMSLGLVCFAIAVVKLKSNTLLLGDPDVNKLIYEGIRIGIWNSIENDFVLSAACLPAVPPFFRASKLLAKKQFTSLSRRTYVSINSFGRMSGRDDAQAMELASNGELPSGAGYKSKDELWCHGRKQAETDTKSSIDTNQLQSGTKSGKHPSHDCSNNV
ncbi:MAG: hypothetical protein Q9160_006211 [Pyrenula sp. 1 TL-2023]